MCGEGPPTLADTKRKFLEMWKFPVPAIYNGVLQELLASQHFVRFSVNYVYSPARSHIMKYYCKPFQA